MDYKHHICTEVKRSKELNVDIESVTLRERRGCPYIMGAPSASVLFGPVLNRTKMIEKHAIYCCEFQITQDIAIILVDSKFDDIDLSQTSAADLRDWSHACGVCMREYTNGGDETWTQLWSTVDNPNGWYSNHAILRIDFNKDILSVTNKHDTKSHTDAMIKGIDDKYKIVFSLGGIVPVTVKIVNQWWEKF